MDYSKIRREILVSCRGSLTQMQLSRILGFTYNQIGKWESGSIQMKWDHFCAVCHARDIPLEKALRDVFLIYEDYPFTAQSIVHFLRKLHSRLSIPQLAKKLSCHSTVLRRWLSGEVQPDLESIFHFMDLRPNMFSTFIHQLVKVETMPNSYLEKQLIDQIWNHQQFDPALNLIEIFLVLRAYKDLPQHSDAFVAEQTGLSVKEVQKHLNYLLRTQRVQKINGKFALHFPMVLLHGQQLAIARMRKYWTQKALLRFNTPDGIPKNLKHRPNFQSCFMAAVSKEGVEKIAHRMHACFEEVVQIVKEDTGPEEEIRILLMDSFSPDDIPSS